MISIKDKSPDCWAWLDLVETNLIRYEDGTTKKLTFSDMYFTHGKYAGEKLSDVDDVSYLEYLKRSAGDKKDDFTKKYVSVLLKKLKN